MKLVVVSAVYSPEPVVSAQIASDIVKSAAESSIRTLVICPFPSRPSGRAYKGYERRIYERTRLDPLVDVIRVFSFRSSTSTLISRFLENISFGLTSSLVLAIKLSHRDRVFLNTWPLFATFLNLFVVKYKKSRVVRVVQDLYPDSLFSQRRISRRGIVGRYLRKLESKNFALSSVNVTISSVMRDQILESYDDVNDIELIPNWSNLPAQEPSVPKRLRALNGNFDGAILAYGGSLSVASGITELIEAFAELLRGGIRGKLIVAGQGSEEGRCHALVEKIGLREHVIFIPEWLPSETISVLRMADLLVLPTCNDQGHSSLPSKLLSYFAAGRPVVAYSSKGSAIEEAVCESESGFFGVVDRSGSAVPQIANLLGTAIEQRVFWRDMGANGKSYLDSRLSPAQGVQAYKTLLFGEGPER